MTRHVILRFCALADEAAEDQLKRVLSLFDLLSLGTAECALGSDLTSARTS